MSYTVEYGVAVHKALLDISLTTQYHYLGGREEATDTAAAGSVRLFASPSIDGF